ncbi:bifunctional UDP-N-acetylglucosamine diphosphorylase/glucosamine-1-phosphate N-acetyltransferase GlmU [Planktotalea sp.]|uniref:bifunctional UDP-N-acetylglucosamine diphosphorylase/glucosamine-1-phosphate N-acetyltransferase GlmU n=1 Tax=Planktotalea sp. TaxID=2029877 RepID=UPI003299AE21
MSIALIILAAGKGTRMKSDLPKVLHHVAGAPMLVHAMKSAEALEPEKTIVVAGHGSDAVSKAATGYNETAEVVLQTEQLGTAHAVAQAKDALSGFEGDALVLYGDTPFISPETLQQMSEARANHDVIVLGFEARDPGKYGRLIMNGDSLAKIVEFKDASDEERAITLCNSGVICAKSSVLFDLIDAVGNENASGEYYLTDIVEIAQAKGLSATSVTCDESETLGVNSRVQLAEADAIFQAKARIALMEGGVTMHAPDTVYLSHDTYIGADTIIEPNVVFGPEVTVENGAHIRAFSHLEGAHVSRGAVVGPYARLRPGTELAEDTKIGNFVELKNAVVDEGAKVNHLSYVGDAHVGARANIGAGTITCNYDGVMKHHTEIGADSFIGSNTLLVAPVSVGANAMTGSGTVVTKDVPDTDLAIARAPQVNKTGLAVKLFDMLKKKKASKAKGAE